MNDPVWYYAQGDAEKGPLSTAQIKALAAAGKIRPQDFVWKEGMDSWAAAREVSELFGGEGGNENATAEAKSGPQKKLPSITPVPSASRQPSPAIPFGQATLAVGLLAVIMARGCDSLGSRHVDRLHAIVDMHRREFQHQWALQRELLEDELQQISSLTSRDSAQQQRMMILTRQLAQLGEQMEDRRTELEQGLWRTQKAAALDAEQNNRLWGFWREAAFLAGTMILTFGLLTIGFTSVGPERWICLALLSAILFSIYLSTAWQGQP